jgi:hypothetical protein
VVSQVYQTEQACERARFWDSHDDDDGNSMCVAY